jgi:hypothetical protein
MYKKVKQYALNHGFTVEEKNGLIYGRMNGFFITIRQDPTVQAKHTVHLWIKENNTAAVPAIADFLNQCTSKHQYLQSASYSGTKVTAEFQGLGFKWGKQYTPCLDAFLQEFTSYCNANGLISCCESCGSGSSLNLYQIGEAEHILCSSCYSNTSDNLQRQAAEHAKKGSGNIIGGIVGALLGALIGVAAWVVIYQLGYISGIAGLVMIICSLKGYELLGGHLSKAGVIISCIISVIMVIVAEQVCLGIEIYNAYNDYYEITFFDAFRSATSFLEEADIRNAVIYDLVMGYILMVVGAFGTIRQAYKNSSGKTDTRMLSSVTSANPMERN